AVGRVHVERLHLLLVGGGALGGVAHVAETDIAQQRAHVTGAEGLAHHAGGLGLVHHTGGFGGGDAGGVLPAVLQQQERVVDVLVDRSVADHSDDAAHQWFDAPSAYAPTRRTAPPSTPFSPCEKSSVGG